MKKKNIIFIIALILTLVLGYLIVSVIIDNNKRNKELQEYQNKLNAIRSSYNNYIEYINKYNIFEHIGLKYLEIKVIKNNLKLTNNLNNSIKNEKYKTIIDYILIKKDGYNIKNTYNNPDLNKIIKTKLSKPSKKYVINLFKQE